MNRNLSKVAQRFFTRPDIYDLSDNTIVLYDMSLLEGKLKELAALFPASALHAIAVKANPLRKIIEKINSLGFGAEAASIAELHIALKAGIPAHKIVFDSPVKTKEEILFALERGIHINADSIEELDRIKTALNYMVLKGSIGVRINPQVGSGKILSTSVGAEYSKFGVPIKEEYTSLKASFLENDWLRCVHVHIGSQGCPLDLLIAGIKTVMAFVSDVNSTLHRMGKAGINTIDIGGGLPADYYRNNSVFTLKEYTDALRTQIPELFSPDVNLITEFGRSIHAGSGWVMSKVEYVKKHKNINTAMIHVGADMFLRECYNPADWHHEFSVLDKNGKLKTGTDTNRYMIAGPLCFAGDIIGRDISLPPVEPGNWIVIHDAGAYTFSMWSRYNSRLMPKIIGYQNNGEAFELLKKRELLEDVLNFWS